MAHDRHVPPAGVGAEPEVAVWLAGAAARAHFDAAAQTPEDAERWRRIARPARLEEWEVSRALLAHARRWLGSKAAAPVTARAPSFGIAATESESAQPTRTAPATGARPATRTPPGTRDPSLSLTHSGGYAAVAASRAAEVRVGVDLECSTRARDVMRLARFAFAEREVAQLEALPADTRAERFYILWTLKEAFAKALPLPLLASLSRCEFLEAQGEWHGSVPNASAWAAQVFRASPTLVLSVVAVLPETIAPGDVRVAASEWPQAPAQPWRTLATLRSRNV